MAAREGDFMKTWFGAAAVVLAAFPAFAADVATCTLSADKKTVTVTASNPYAQVMACEVNCNMAIPDGFSTVVCVKPVPAGVLNCIPQIENVGWFDDVQNLIKMPRNLRSPILIPERFR